MAIALEKVEEGVGRACAQEIDSASTAEFKPFFHDYINKTANIVTDQWTGYSPLKKESHKVKQVPSKDGKIFLTCISTL